MSINSQQIFMIIFRSSELDEILTNYEELLNLE
jgi:hypothetical protein